jgi:hypothetical protein
MVSRKSLLAAVASLALAASAQAAVAVTSFETGLFDGVGSGVTQAASTTGVTDGGQSVALTLPATYWLDGAQMYGQRANLLTAGIGKLELDVTGGAASGELWPILNCDPNWDQVFPAIQWQPGVTTHMVFDISASIAKINPTGWGANLEFGVNSYNTAQTIYIDNVVLTAVPEPTVLVGMGVVSLGLMLRKRSR